MADTSAGPTGPIGSLLGGLEGTRIEGVGGVAAISRLGALSGESGLSGERRELLARPRIGSRSPSISSSAAEFPLFASRSDFSPSGERGGRISRQATRDSHRCSRALDYKSTDIAEGRQGDRWFTRAARELNYRRDPPTSRTASRFGDQTGRNRRCDRIRDQTDHRPFSRKHGS